MRVSPDEEIVDWRAVCVNSARTVRREGWRKAIPTPIKKWFKCKDARDNVLGSFQPGIAALSGIKKRLVVVF